MARCPICTDVINNQGQRFLPCPCGFQLCFWCFKKIQDTINTCPKCRAPYIDENMQFRSGESDGDDDDDDEIEGGYIGNSDDQHSDSSLSALSSTSTVSSHILKRKETRCIAATCGGGGGSSTSGITRGNTLLNNGAVSNSSASAASSNNRISLLRDVRVVRRDLCYLVGLPLETTMDELSLKSFDYFGKYGKVVNIIVNRNPNFKSPDKKKSCAVYITYSAHSEAKLAINDIDQCMYQNRKLRASYGTTKYCSNYLRSQKCNNKTCFYLHQKGADEDSFTIDQLNLVKEKSRDLTCSAILSHELNDGMRVCPTGTSLFGKTRPEVIAVYESLLQESKCQVHTMNQNELILTAQVPHPNDSATIVGAPKTCGNVTESFTVLSCVRNEIANKIKLVESSSNITLGVDQKSIIDVSSQRGIQINNGQQICSELVVVPPPPRIAASPAPMVHPSLRKEWGWNMADELSFSQAPSDQSYTSAFACGSPSAQCVAPPKMTQGPSQLIKMQCVTMADLTASYSGICTRDAGPSRQRANNHIMLGAPPGL